MLPQCLVRGERNTQEEIVSIARALLMLYCFQFEHGAMYTRPGRVFIQVKGALTEKEFSRNTTFPQGIQLFHGQFAMMF